MRKLFLTFFALIFTTAALAKGGAVTSADPRATEAGQEILRAGGSAADAALAMMLVLSVVEPQSSGIGGGGFLVHFDAKSGKTGTINGRETAPAAVKPDRFLGKDGKPEPFIDSLLGGRSVGVPGNIALMGEAHRKWGKLPWARLFDPAIRIAENGYVVTPRLAGVIRQMSKFWTDFPDTQSLYAPDGKPKAAGETIRNPAKAALLRDIAKHGPKAFYSGDNAKAIAKAATEANRGAATITTRDIARYRALPQDTVCVPYRVWTLCGMGPPSSGATTVFQILGMIERFDMKAMGKDDPRSWHVIAEAMQLAYADREKWLGDPNFVSVPVKGLLDKDYMASRSAMISFEKKIPAYTAGNPPGAAPRTAAISGEVAGTTHFIATDGAGNVASMTSTVEGPFGSQLLANGVVLNNELTDFSRAPEKDGAPVANRPQAGKRPLSSMSPTIVFDARGKPVFAVGAAGGKRIIMQVTKTLIAHLDWGLNARDAIAAPNIYFTDGAVIVEANTPLAAMAGDLSKYSGTILTTDLMPSKANSAEWTAGGWKGAADPRSDGSALEE